MLRLFVPISITLALAGCSNVQPDEFGKDAGAGDADTDADSDTDTDADSDTDTDTDTDPGEDGFDEPGDVVAYADDGGVVEVDLTDTSGDSNQGQEFYLLVVNTASTEVGYRLRYYDAAQFDAEGAPPPGRSAPSPVVPRPSRAAPPPAAPPPPPPIDAGDIGIARDEFLVRDDLNLTTHYSAVSATLWAVGDNVAIWVDDDVPIDWDIDCDGVVDIADQYDAYGFDNCDLADVAEIIDTNIIPNVNALYGDESDIDGDGRVAVVITPVLNAITLTSDDEADFSRVLSSYAEPNVDLADFNYRDNPGSDEQEVLYVFAPDPYGFFNPNVTPTVTSYTGYQLAAEVARSFTALVSYNQHHIVNGGDVEEDWVNDVLGTFAAEYCGFGAAYYADAWEYLDATQTSPLASEAGLGSLATLSRGAQYLFGLWLYEQAEAETPGSGATLLTSIIQTDGTGVAAVGGDEEAFAQLVLGWQVAMLTSGVTDTDGNPLVDPADWPAYPSATLIDAPPASPGGFYGANGYQHGLDLSGVNYAYNGGTTDAATEIPSARVRLGNTDAYLYTPGLEFIGWMDGGYSAQVVRLTGITYDRALAQLQASGEGLVGAVVRWNDPVTSDFAVENIFSATASDAVDLPALPPDGSSIHGIGQLTGPGTVTLIDTDGATSEVDVPDTDRWRLDLTDRNVGDPVEVVVWLDRHFATTTGSMGPDDPWIAVVPRELAPEPTVDGTQRGDTCPGGEDFSYPRTLLEHLSSQVFLSSTMTTGDEDDGDWCGEPAASGTTCETDWDRDGVLDADEPQPDSFLAQTRVMECTQNGNVAPDTWSYSEDWLDIDELDEDDLPTVDMLWNAGGRSGPEGEEGYVRITLEGGREYLIVIGAGDGDIGTYEFSVRQVL